MQDYSGPSLLSTHPFGKRMVRWGADDAGWLLRPRCFFEQTGWIPDE